ncbi:hypothetical protein BC829DRAFT_385789 [Chytridium lagenaria]|nr:hypothetical protein BC829DRAFT_385789 [Chytridium lagenaria]
MAGEGDGRDGSSPRLETVVQEVKVLSTGKCEPAKRVLVVEDNSINQTILKRMLQKANVSASLPGMDGLTCTRRIREMEGRLGLDGLGLLGRAQDWGWRVGWMGI